MPSSDLEPKPDFIIVETNVTGDEAITTTKAKEANTSEMVMWIFGVRGFAACLVMCHHLGDLVHGNQSKNAERPVYWMPIEFFFRGVSVGIFFVLSGFSLSLRYYCSIDSEKIARILSSSTFRRAFRLFVPAFVAGLVSYIVYESNGFAPGMEMRERKKGTFNAEDKKWFDWSLPPVTLDAMRASERVQAFFQDMFYRVWVPSYLSPFNIAFWTLAIELCGSFILFLSLLAVLNLHHGLRRFIFLALSISGIYFPASWAQYIVQFVAGSLLADLYLNPLCPKKSLKQRIRISPKFRKLARILVPIAKWCHFIFAYYLISFPNQDPLTDSRYAWMKHIFPERTKATCHYIGSILIVFGIQLLLPIQRLFQSRGMVFIGRLCFGLYLFHIVYLHSFIACVYLHVDTYSPWAIYFILLPLLFLSTGITAYIFARLVDEPFARLLRKFENVSSR